MIQTLSLISSNGSQHQETYLFFTEEQFFVVANANGRYHQPVLNFMQLLKVKEIRIDVGTISVIAKVTVREV